MDLKEEPIKDFSCIDKYKLVYVRIDPNNNGVCSEHILMVDYKENNKIYYFFKIGKWVDALEYHVKVKDYIGINNLVELRDANEQEIKMFYNNFKRENQDL